jgi:hypothetical protein
VPTAASLVINISNINNAPYNGSLIEAYLEVQNQNSYSMQVCSFSQPAPTALRNSTGLSLQNWDPSVGSSSNATLTLNTYFTPFTTRVLLVSDSNFTIAPLAPSNSTSTATQGNNTLSYLGGGVASSRSLSFLLKVTNPPSQQPVQWTVYVIYSNSLFVEQYTATGLTLTPLTLSLTLALANNKTMVSSAYNCSTTLPYLVTTSPQLTLTISYGTISCSSLNLQSNSLLNVLNCSASALSLTAASLSTGTLWVSFDVLNHFSVRGDNGLTLTLTGASPSYYSVGSGSTPIGLAINDQPFSVISSNSTFAAATSFTITEGTLSLAMGTARKFTISMPADLQLISTTVTANSENTVIANYSVSAATNSILLNLQGPLQITIANLSNPAKYLGSVLWNFTGMDSSDNPSSFSQASLTPSYSPATASASLQFSSPIIETISTLELSLLPALQYASPPTVTITIPNSVLQSVCPSCSLLSPTAFSFPYSSPSSPLMKVNVTLKNSNHPLNNSLSVIISSNITFETASVTYTLQPMTFGYV